MDTRAGWTVFHEISVREEEEMNRRGAEEAERRELGEEMSS
jgi:hypothetical protein